MKVSRFHWKKSSDSPFFKMMILRTVRDFLTAALPPLQWNPKTVTSNKTTVPAKPLTDEMNLSAWDTFDSDYQTWRASFC